MKKFIKKNSLTIVAILLTLLVIKGGVDAATSIAGTNVTYKDNYSLGATTVQAAVDKLCSKVSNIDTRVTTLEGKHSLDTLNTTKINSNGIGSWNYKAISGLSNYDTIYVKFIVGESEYPLYIYRVEESQNFTFTSFAGTNYYSSGSLNVDWTNNRIGVKTNRVVGWSENSTWFSHVVGISKK